MNRRGFTLVEALAGSVLSAVLALLIGGVLTHSFARLRDRSERMGMEQSFRVGSAAAGALLEPLGSDSVSGRDVSLASAQSLIARATRGSGVLCLAGLDHVVVRSGSGWWHAVRGLVPGRDSLMIASIDGPSRWLAVPLLANPASLACPDGSNGTRLPTAVPPERLAMIGPGSPLKAFEPVELRVYSSAGASWLGLRLAATGESIQPLAGPVARAELRYYDRDGGLADPSSASLVALSITGLTERAGGIGLARLASGRADSTVIAVGYRGMP
jgi:hypothetical protein